MAWLALVGLEAFLMVSTWRYRSFKDLNLLKPRSPFSIILLGSLIFSIWTYSQPVLLAISTTYMLSGIVVRMAGLIKRHLFPGAPKAPEQKGAMVG